MKKKFGDARRTILSHDTSSMDMEDLIAEEDIVITISHQGYIKRQTLDNFRNQKRGGVGKTGGSGKKMTIVQSICSCRQLIIIFFSLPIKVVFIGKRL